MISLEHTFGWRKKWREAFFLTSRLVLQIPFCPERKFLARRRPSIRRSDSPGSEAERAASRRSVGRSGEDHFRQRFQNKPKKYAQASVEWSCGVGREEEGTGLAKYYQTTRSCGEVQVSHIMGSGLTLVLVKQIADTIFRRNLN